MERVALPVLLIHLGAQIVESNENNAHRHEDKVPTSSADYHRRRRSHR